LGGFSLRHQMTRFFIISENNDSFEIETVGGINLRTFGEKILWYGNLEPSLNFEGHEISRISFCKIFLTPDLLIIDGQISLQISNHSMVTLKLFSVPGTL
jgi:hypothetical protein